jgi:tRNA pseudouridine55 synthase
MSEVLEGGILVVDKPEGPTSHDVVARLRKALGTRQVGHAGTLDPMATGVLVVAIGEATKLVPWLTSDDKAYEASIALGATTDTLDAQGQVVGALSPPPEEVAQALRDVADGRGPSPVLVRALERERARTMQVPPAFSAIKVDGRRSHELARAGKPPEHAPREVTVRRLDVTGAALAPQPRLDVVVEATKGYFVRSLARDLAEALGTRGHLVRLRRTRSGAFSLDDAIALDASPGALRSAVLPLDEAAARALPVTLLTPEGVVAAGHGKRVAPSQMRDPHPRPSAWLDAHRRLVAVGEVDAEGVGRVLRGFPR